VRIIAGRFRGTALAAVGKGDAAAHLRPTTDRVRESLFSILNHHDVMGGARVLDVFAGTGALGFEALSRGAETVCFIENGRAALRLLSENQRKLRVEDETSILRRDALRPGLWSEAPFDLIFLDPPYGQGMGQTALQRLREGCWIADGAMVVWEENALMGSPEGFDKIDARRYGDTYVTLLRCTSV
jgi:16S rRNA (guanine966-N2)-methyltransferase